VEGEIEPGVLGGAGPADPVVDASGGADLHPSDLRTSDLRTSALRRWVVFFGLAVGVVVADQASKSVIDSAFKLAATQGAVPGFAEPTQVIGDLVRIAKSYNDGGLFGLFDAAAPILALASLVVIGILVVVQARGGPRASWLTTVALGLLLGGAIGNLLDRIRFGYVIDWVDMGIGSWRFYTFNVADSAISIAIVLLLAAAIFGRQPADEAGR
jgi:signal peptidase II